jgi:hypothetical protein
MSRRETVGEQRWPNNPAFNRIATAWCEAVARDILDLVWCAFDDMKKDVLSHVDLTRPTDELERSLTSYHTNKILLRWKAKADGFESFIPKAEEPEFESRKKAPARSKAADMAFVHKENFRFAWAIEAKVLKSPRRVDAYLTDITKKMLLCHVAPFMSQGAVIGYLLAGSPDEVFHEIAHRLKKRLTVHPAFGARPHRCSRHRRTVPVGKDYPSDYLCHHLVMTCANDGASNAPN